LWSQGIRLVCKATSVVVLARFVPPAEHGVFAMAASLTVVLVLFRDFGMGAAALRVPRLSEEQKTTLLWLHAVIGTGLTLATVALAPALAAFYHEPRVQPLLFAMCGSMLLIGLNNWPRVLLARELRFAELNQLETLAAVVSTVLMIAAGVLGAGAYSFVVFLLASEGVLAIGAWRVCRWRPAGLPRWRSLQELWRNGVHLTGYNLLIHLVHQIDTLLMGRWFGAQPLGLYTRPAQVVMIPSLHIAAPLSQVLLATLARLETRTADYARLTRETTNLIAHLTLPFAAGCFALPDVVVRVVFGPAWLDAAPLLRWLALSAAMSYCSASVYALCVAAGNTRRLAAMSAVTLVAIVVGITLGRAHGPVGLAAGVALANLALVVPRLWWATWGTPVRLRHFGSALLGPLLVSGALAAGLAGARHLAAGFGADAEIALAVSGGLAAVFLVAAILPGVRRELRRVWAHRPGGRP
jgi:PST family polysaccharide transporter